MMIRFALLAALVATPAIAGEGWRRLATPDDRQRLRGWRSAWMEALPAARAGGGRDTIAREAALFDPDRALDGPMPPAGAYRCRTFKLGGRSAGFTPFAWSRCRVEGDGRFSRVDGPQRPVGVIHPDTSGRAVFLGTLALGGERRPLAYGRDRARDMAGVVERVGERRWRVVLPYPRFESTLDVIELVPDSVGTTGGGTTAGLGATAGAGSGGNAAR